MTYQQAIQFLYDLQMFGTKLGLENTIKLAALAGTPQEKLRFIHVAGTNGKGSTCAILESIYRAAGLRVGLFTSPHLVSFAERIQVNRQLISESEVTKLVGEMKSLLEQFPANQCPTFFEVVTVMALKYFAEQRCDLVVWETGMGGRLDATNIVNPLVSVITNVQFDHQQWLGDTLEKIAFEKAGIIKPGVPVITGAMDTEALRVIAQTAQEKGAPLKVVNPADVESFVPESVVLSLEGAHQRMNAAVALATLDALQSVIVVSEEAKRQGLQSVSWSGRFQIIKPAAERTIVLDGAHNPAGAETLRAAIEKHFPNIKPTLILGVLRDKDYAAICATFAAMASRILLVPVDSERTAQPVELLPIFRRENPTTEVICCDSLRQALQQAETAPFVVISGSLYLVGEALEFFSAEKSDQDERGLNEWSGTPSRGSRP